MYYYSPTNRRSNKRKAISTKGGLSCLFSSQKPKRKSSAKRNPDGDVNDVFHNDDNKKGNPVPLLISRLGGSDDESNQSSLSMTEWDLNQVGGFYSMLNDKKSADPKYPLLCNEDKKKLDNRYEKKSNVSYEKPIRISRHKCKEDRVKKMNHLSNENILMVFEEPKVHDMKKKLPGNKVSRLDERRWEERGIKALHLIQPPKDPGSFQVYQAFDASEVHYECMGREIITAMECAGIECFFYPNDKSCRSSYCWVNNSQDDLSNHFKKIDHLDLDALVEKYATAELSSDGRNKRSRKQATSFGICCTLMNTFSTNLHCCILPFISHKIY